MDGLLVILLLPLGEALFFVYSTADFEVAWLGRGREKRGLIFAPTHGYSGCKTARLSTCVKSPENRHDPYLDTVENGSTLGKPDIHGPQPDPKAQNLTPDFWNFDPWEKARSDRLCRAL